GGGGADAARVVLGVAELGLARPRLVRAQEERVARDLGGRRRVRAGRPAEQRPRGDEEGESHVLGLMTRDRRRLGTLLCIFLVITDLARSSALRLLRTGSVIPGEVDRSPEPGLAGLRRPAIERVAQPLASRP